MLYFCMKNLREKRVLTRVRKENRELERQKIYRALIKTCEFLNYEDLLVLRGKEFLDLCGVRQIKWKRNPNPFVDTLILKENESVSALFPSHFYLSLSLEYKRESSGALIFISERKFSSAKKKALKKIADAVAAAVYFMDKRAKLESLKFQWNVTFDSFHRALCIADENFKIIRANQSFSQLVSLPKKALFGQTVFSCLCIPEKEIKTAGFSLFHTINNRKLKIRSSPLWLEEDRFILLMASDITKKSHLQEQLSLKARETEMGFIRGSIAHELNNPLAGMKTLLHIMETGAEIEKANHKEIREEIRSAVERCERIVETILKASRKPPVLARE